MKHHVENIFQKGKKIRILWLIVIIFVNMILIAGILTAGLWPFSFFPENGCEIDPVSGSLNFKRPGVAYLKFPLASCPSKISETPFSMHFKLQPFGTPWYSAQIITVYSAKKKIFSIFQWKSSLVVQSGDKKVAFSGIMDKDHIVNFTVKVTDLVVMVIYDDKKRLFHTDLSERWKMSSGLMIVGNNASLRGPWYGVVYSIKFVPFTGRECELLTSKENVERNNKKDALTKKKSIPDAAGLGQNSDKDTAINYFLQVPSRMIPFDATFLTPPWKDFGKGRRYLLDLLLNVIGFIPLGISLSILFQHLLQARFNWILVITSCCMLSLSIEILQAFLITRTSQLSDLMLNTCGGALGVAMYLLLKRISQR